jgi:hypothetical protein
MGSADPCLGAVVMTATQGRILVGSSLWREIRGRASKSKTLLAVVSYLGRHPGTLLRWPKNSTVICDLSRDTVRRGASSARGARELHAKTVGLWSVRALHAKIYIFDKSAIVSSANLSEASTRLVEAGVLITNAESLKRLRSHAKQLQASALPMNDDVVLAELVKLEPKRPAVKIVGRALASGRTRMPFFDNDPVWLTTGTLDGSMDHGSRSEVSTSARSLLVGATVSRISSGSIVS